MVDPIQRQSSVPLPDFQTGRGSRDPLPLNSPKEQNRLDALAQQTRGEAARDRFEDYLDGSSGVTTLEKTEPRSTLFDPAAEIAAASVYAQPGTKTPV